MDKNRLLQVYLQQQTAPKITEHAAENWVSYGDGEYRNYYPQFLIDIYNSSATHSAIINASSAMISGGEILIEEDGGNLSAFVQLKKFLASVNRNGDTAHELVTKLSFDLKLFGAYAMNVIWSKDKSKIAEIHHIPVEQVRVGKKNESGLVDEYWLSSDWSKYRQKEYTPRRVAAYNKLDRSEASQIIYCGLYSPGMEAYFTPDYLASTNWILTDHLTSEFHLSNITNGFSPSFWINFNNGIPTQEERYKIEHQIKEKFNGAGNAGKFVLTFSDDANSAPDLQPIALSDADKQYTVLNELCIQNIMIGHRVTSPMLLGVKTEGQLGGRNELMTAYELYSNTVINPMKDIALKGLKMVLDCNNINLPISLSEVSPLSSMFDTDILQDVLTQDEIREQLGYEPLEQAEEVNSRFSKTCCSAVPTALDNFINTYGEDADEENWELIDEQEVELDDEHSDFDFEHNLNELNHKVNFVRTGEARKRGSKQDGIDKDFNLYRVRYRYAGKTKKHTSERTFCKAMVNANKIYRKEDIIGQAHALSNIAANKGHGPNGSDVYNIWLYKGGVNCHHKWVREIYFRKFGTGKPNYDTDEVINKTKARSRGFRPEENDQRIYQAPIDMPNQGRLN